MHSQANLSRHERFKSLARTNFPLVLCYGMTVHKSQGLTFTGRCVFNMEHEPTWSPFKNMCGLAFVGCSRVTDFSKMACKYVPDYWSFHAMAETDLFRWRSALEKRLDTLHDQTAAILFDGKASVEDDVSRDRSWSEGLRRSKLTEAEVADLTHMLSLLPQPGYYTDKPVRRPANKAGGGRSQRKTMRGRGEVPATTSGPSSLPVTGEDHATFMSDDDRHPCEEEEPKELELDRQEIRAKMDEEEQLRFELGRGEEDEALMSDDDYCPLRGEEVSKELELEREKILRGESRGTGKAIAGRKCWGPRNTESCLPAKDSRVYWIKTDGGDRGSITNFSRSR